MSTYTPQAPAPSDRTEGTPAPSGRTEGTKLQDDKVRKWLEIGGVIAAIVLIAFGGGSIMMSIQGRGVVKKELTQQKIVGAPDMTPKTTALEAKQSGLPKSVPLPSCNVAGKTVSDGATARCFASYMWIHAMLSTGGELYSQLPQYASADGAGTNDFEKALKNPQGQPVENPSRQLWVTETALSTALNASFMADQLGLFGIVVGVALLLAGIGFGILALGGALRTPATALPRFVRRRLTRAQALEAGV